MNNEARSVDVVPRSLRWETDARYYLVHIHLDLFGHLTLSRYWGGKRTRTGGEKHERLESHDELALRLKAIARNRERHGYRCMTLAADSAPAKMAG